MADLSFLGEPIYNGSSIVGYDYAKIPNGLPIYVMRHLIENNTTLARQGDIYVGTNTYNTISFSGQEYGYYSTKGFMSESAAPHTTLYYDVLQGFSYKFIPWSATDITPYIKLASSLELSVEKLNLPLTIDTLTQMSYAGQFPYGKNLCYTQSVYSFNGASELYIPCTPDTMCLLYTEPSEFTVAGGSYHTYPPIYIPKLSDMSSSMKLIGLNNLRLVDIPISQGSQYGVCLIKNDQYNIISLCIGSQFLSDVIHVITIK